MAADPDPLLDALRQATLGEYEIIAGVGRGGMGTVYLAHDLALDRKVAIKVLSPALVLIGGVMVDRFKREARTAASLNHPHILPIYAVKESGPLLYFVMKFVEGRTLDSIIGEVGPVPIAMVQAILVQVGDALGYAHRRGIIHRDIKCSNIMLDEEGWAVVTDFGIAKVTQAEGLTMTGVAIGTPAYMSPEQFTTKEVTGSSDQYSLGVVAYEILTGKSPFAGDSVMALMYAHVNESPRPIAELRPDCPPGLAAAVMRMLEKDAAKRWAGVDDIVGAIGASPLAHDDPVRRLMIALAKTGRHSQLLAQLRTPTSPIPSATRHPRLPARAPVPRGRRVPKVWWGVVAAAGIGAALWWLGPWRTRDAPPAPQAVAGVESVIATPAPSQGRADTVDHGSQPESIARPGPVAPPRRRRAAATEAPAAPPAQLPTPPAATQREDSLMRSLRVAALEALRRAVDAGAAASDLATGDTAFRAGESLAAQGRLSEAMVRLATAASLWAEAERLSRTRRVARDTAQPRAAEPAAQPPAARAPVDARPEIEKAIAEYGRAIESLDLAEVRRVYPWLTAEQIRGWTQFFRRVRRLTATLTVTELDVAGARAEAKVSGAYEYENASTRRTERELATFRVSLEQQPGGWRLTAIR